MGLGFWPWNFRQKGVTQFCRILRGESLSYQSKAYGKVINLKIPGFFFKKKYIYFNQPCLEFFWNRLAQGVPCMTPSRLPRSDLPSLIQRRCTLHCHQSGKSANWVILPILVNSANQAKICRLIWRMLAKLSYSVSKTFFTMH